MEYMVQRIKRRCVERCEQKCMVHKNGKEKKEDTQRLFESFFSLVLSLFSVCIFIRISWVEIACGCCWMSGFSRYKWILFATFLYRFFFLFILMLPFGIRVSFERQRYSTRSLYIKPNWMEIMLRRGYVAFRLTNTIKIHFMLVVMLIIVKMSRF